MGYKTVLEKAKKGWLQAFKIAVLDGVQNSVGKGKKRLVTSIDDRFP